VVQTGAPLPEGVYLLRVQLDATQARSHINCARHRASANVRSVLLRCVHVVTPTRSRRMREGRSASTLPTTRCAPAAAPGHSPPGQDASVDDQRRHPAFTVDFGVHEIFVRDRLAVTAGVGIAEVLLEAELLARRRSDPVEAPHPSQMSTTPRQ
jgi:hypothetical protein